MLILSLSSGALTPFTQMHWRRIESQLGETLRSSHVIFFFFLLEGSEGKGEDAKESQGQTFKIQPSLQSAAFMFWHRAQTSSRSYFGGNRSQWRGQAGPAAGQVEGRRLVCACPQHWTPGLVMKRPRALNLNLSLSLSVGWSKEQWSPSHFNTKASCKKNWQLECRDYQWMPHKLLSNFTRIEQFQISHFAKNFTAVMRPVRENT